MTAGEYTYICCTGSITTQAGGRLGETTSPLGYGVIDKLNALGAEGWEIDHITAAPLTTRWVSPRGGRAAAGFTDKVHHVAFLRRPVGTSP